jgi:hypothetical protein
MITESDIEVTPAMIEAGVSAFFDFDPRFEDEEKAVERIFLAMLKAGPAASVLQSQLR